MDRVKSSMRPGGIPLMREGIWDMWNEGERRKFEVEEHGKSQEIRDRPNQITTRTTLMKRAHQG